MSDGDSHAFVRVRARRPAPAGPFGARVRACSGWSFCRSRHPIQIQTAFRDGNSSLVAPCPSSGGLSSSGLIEFSKRLALSLRTSR